MQCHFSQADPALCQVCHNKLDLSIYILPCGHRYHKLCLESIMKTANLALPNTGKHPLTSSVTLTPAKTLSAEEFSQSTPFPLFNKTPKPAPDPLPWNQLPDLTFIKQIKKPSISSKTPSRLPVTLVCKLNDLTRQEYELCCAVCEIPQAVIENIKENTGNEIAKILYYLEQEKRLEHFIEFLRILEQKECLEAINFSSASFLFSISQQSFSKSEYEIQNSLKSFSYLIESKLKGYEERLWYQCGMGKYLKQDNLHLYDLLKKIYEEKNKDSLPFFLDKIKKSVYLTPEKKEEVAKVFKQIPMDFYFCEKTFEDPTESEPYLEQTLAFVLELFLKIDSKDLVRFFKKCGCNEKQARNYLNKGSYLFFIETYKKKQNKGLHQIYTNFLDSKYFSNNVKQKFKLAIYCSPCSNLFQT